ncbi:RING protein [Venustampulla echinocandica]|uniref:RING protein n=1 Tax=Venustampulla echinocandica TaxID=2656787 RepID=A0A370TLV6_9HELO|nr:RING protein [Venustampulla echinocandica]RDL36508.1 RING protein [Venustampulla echinocandica]
MAPQDSFIDEDDDSCPLCVEEFDLSDKNFRPCPCGYQVCQFCFNNIKNNMNGLCPACRRPYDEKTIEWKVVTPEEIAQFKANIQKNAKKKAEQRQKEAQKREVESLNRKHLSGLRVVQKNLVYVVGLSPAIRDDEILQTLRGDKYFGQYGKIIKIVVSKSKQGDPTQSSQGLGVYVTFARKDDAARCIAAVNGSQNGDRILRAQLGTTKYCSAYLRNETCTNKQCMFLHEPGDNDDSYSRQDLSSINSVNTQRPLPAMASSSRQAATVAAPLQQVQPVTAAAQSMNRESSKDGSDSGDGSALPSSASWANRGIQQRSRRGSHATSGAASSPAVSHAMPATVEVAEESAVLDQEPESEIQDPASSSDVAASNESPRPQRNLILVDLLKSINSPSLSFPLRNTTEDSPLSSTFPPLFDDHGGEKRRARKHQEEEARLHIDQESQNELRSVAEPAEEEEPESGSLQLGGEPEDRDGGREVPQGFQRRPSAQLPIQRTNNGPVGPGVGNFPRNLNNLTSINGRTLTPQQQQQLLLLNSSQPQSSFMDQFTPGLGSQLSQSSGLFQQQGHNRQSSRYSFANEGASGSSIKPSANPKLMAQQASMMPSTSHAQTGNQFYGSSIQGPPPGLKSTGTPPIGGGMFGQNHAFGGSMGGGPGFGGIAKDSNSEMLRDMLRSRGTAGGGQSHDTGKREFMFPSFLQQYPSASSTPAPASGLLASLYGPQTGAFHDFGQKQKKKGKKHRHANTSSSGGGGLVDLADPSILQARMQHQQQSNAGVGQGLFGSQAQDDQGLPSLDEATLSVDALVADSTTDDFGPHILASYDAVGSRSSTPSVPPGFDTPHAHPPPPTQQEALGKLASKIVPTSAPFTPSRTSSFIPRTATPLSNVSLPEGAPSENTALAISASASQAKQDVKALATDTGLSKTIVSQSTQALQSEDFPALDSAGAKLKAPATPTSSKSQPVKPATTVTSKNTTTTTLPGNMSAPPSGPKGDKRPMPGILNISVPTKTVAKATIAPDTPTKTSVSSSAFPPLPPSTPSATSVQSTLSRNVPKTLRLVPVKPEAAAGGSGTPSSVTSTFPPGLLPSRQPSLASVSRQERPGTPTSEAVSDNASITTASLSRANSPPPNKIGSAPVRMTTKSKQKKQRREAQKEKEKEFDAAVAATKVEPEVEIAPIMGRKKKQKKERSIHSAAGGSTPVASRPASPSPPIPEKHKQTIEPEVELNKPAAKAKGKGKESGKAKAKTETEPQPAQPEKEEVAAPKPPSLPMPAAVYEQLNIDSELPDPSQLAFFKNLSTPTRTPNPNFETEMPSMMHKLTITSEDRESLLAGLPVRKNKGLWYRIMLTPNGDYVRYLSPEEEERYLQLQEKVSQQTSPTAFVSTKHHANNGFTLIGGRAVPNGPPSYFPPPKGSTAPLDPVSKLQRDEALSYINQYVLPSLSTNSQLEKALNANALDAEMFRSTDHLNFSWGNDPHASDNSSGLPPQEGILAATGLEGMASNFAGDDGGRPLGNVSLLSLSDAESAMQTARKESDSVEKKLLAVMKRNRRLVLGSSGI